jgi:hypothetical protein
VAWWRTVTEVPGNTAPDSSVTEPSIDPPADWAWASSGIGERHTAAATKAASHGFDMVLGMTCLLDRSAMGGDGEGRARR